MKKTITLSAIFVLAVLAGQAQSQSTDTAKEAKIKILFHLMQQDSMINKTMDAMNGAMSARIVNQLRDSAISSDGALVREMNESLEKMKQYSKEMVRRLLNEDMVA